MTLLPSAGKIAKTVDLTSWRRKSRGAKMRRKKVGGEVKGAKRKMEQRLGRRNNRKSKEEEEGDEEEVVEEEKNEVEVKERRNEDKREGREVGEAEVINRSLL